MFYRYTPSGTRIAVDLNGFYRGQTLFLLGGHPSLRRATHMLGLPGVITLAMNNVPAIFPRPTLWVGTDKPSCFSPRLLSLPETIKFSMISRRDETLADSETKLRDLPGFLFFGANENAALDDFLSPARDLSWWKSTFPIALQLAHRLGFARVHLVGCGFSMDLQAGEQYAWTTDLTLEQVKYSRATYAADLKRLESLKPQFEAAGFAVVSSTPDSRANKILEYEDLLTAVHRVRDALPAPRAPTEFKHSSEHVT